MRTAFAAAALLLACAIAGGGSADERPPPSPRTFVLPSSCDGVTPCPGAHWVFQPPDCQDGDLSHPAGTVVMLQDRTTLQCRCRLTWVRTRQGRPPIAKVTCRWNDLQEAWEAE